jgi:hypothetical protein
VSQFLRERLPAILFNDERFLRLRAPPPAAAPSADATGGGGAGSDAAGGSRWNIRKGGGGRDGGSGDPDSDGGSPRDDAAGSGHGGGGFGAGARGRGKGGTSASAGPARSSGRSAVGAAAGRVGAGRGASASAAAGSGTPQSPALLQLSPSALAEARQLTDILGDALAAAEVSLLNASGVNCALSGSTAVVLLIRNGVVHLVNVGDSRAVLALAGATAVPVDIARLGAASAAATMTGNLAPGAGVIGMPLPLSAGQPGAPPVALHQLRAAALASEACFSVPTVRSRMLTVDHKPETPRERQRIMATGGRVMATRIKGAPHVSEELNRRGGFFFRRGRRDGGDWVL